MIVREVHDMKSWSFPMDDRGWYILDKPRRLDRTDLANPGDTVVRTLAFIVKRYGRR